MERKVNRKDEKWRNILHRNILHEYITSDYHIWNFSLNWILSIAFHFVVPCYDNNLQVLSGFRIIISMRCIDSMQKLDEYKSWMMTAYRYISAIRRRASLRPFLRRRGRSIAGNDRGQGCFLKMRYCRLSIVSPYRAPE